MDFLAGIEEKLVAFAMRELAVLANDEVKLLDAGVSAIVAAIHGGTNWETAVTQQLNVLFQGEVTEGKKIIAAFLGFVGRLTHHLVG